MQNILLDEGMRLIMEKLDIRYLLKKILIKENNDLKNMKFMMSDECKEKIRKLYNSFYGL